MLRELCEKFTSLSSNDIDILENMTKNLPNVSNLVKADIFIDCIIKRSDMAIVVAQAKPTNYKSLYQKTIIGEFVLRENEPAVLRTLEIGMGTSDLKAVTQENKAVKQNTVPLKNAEDHVIGVLIMESDISEDVSKSRNMEILSETTEQLSQSLLNLEKPDFQETSYFNLINDAILIFDKHAKSVYVNQKAEDLYRRLGYKDELIGMTFQNLVLSNTSFMEILHHKQSIKCEVVIGTLSLQIKYAVIQKSEAVHGVVMLLKDVSEIKEKEKQLILKAIAIREIHHRVKNNLQTIASILRLQSRRVNNIEAQQAFKDTINRVMSIAATHEVLAQNGIDDVDIKTIVSKIRNNALKSVIQYKDNIKIRLIGDSFYVDSDKSTSIAIVLNELIENSLQHAFEKKKQGYIEITIKKGIMYSNVSVVDNGQGFVVDTTGGSHFGLDIVRSIVRDKLNGNFSIESSEKGTIAVFYFKN